MLTRKIHSLVKTILQVILVIIFGKSRKLFRKHGMLCGLQIICYAIYIFNIIRNVESLIVAIRGRVADCCQLPSLLAYSCCLR